MFDQDPEKEFVSRIDYVPTPRRRIEAIVKGDTVQGVVMEAYPGEGYGGIGDDVRLLLDGSSERLQPSKTFNRWRYCK